MNIRAARPEDAWAIARIHVDGWRATYPGILPDEVLEQQSYERREQTWAETLAQPPADYCVIVAEDDPGGVVGFADGGRERTGDPEYDAELYAIYLRREYQGRGTGRRLVRAVAEHLRGVGMRSLLLWCLEANRYRRFYESLGGQCVRKRHVARPVVMLNEIGYGWADLGVLVSRCAGRAGTGRPGVP